MNALLHMLEIDQAADALQALQQLFLFLARELQNAQIRIRRAQQLLAPAVAGAGRAFNADGQRGRLHRAAEETRGRCKHAKACDAVPPVGAGPGKTGICWLAGGAISEFTCPSCSQVCLDSGIIEGYY